MSPFCPISISLSPPLTKSGCSSARFRHRRSSTVAANGVVASCSKSGCCSVPRRSPLFLRGEVVGVMGCNLRVTHIVKRIGREIA
ncbi:hypothetical protein AAHA92_06104 [Salvia divinorum]|uniref:Uncharacterized protein n=1 Tax=Salvia divinorum TaxID=28513 RepID=A0ABD1I8N6_SALDI